jgi:hypothetical protein
MPFQKGQSGNWAGRPRGLRDKRNRLLTEILAKDERAIAEKLSEMARGGNLTAISLSADYLWSKTKPQGEFLNLPNMVGKTIGEQGQRIIEALVTGEISPEQATDIMRIVASQARIIEVDALEKRVTELEKARGQSS